MSKAKSHFGKYRGIVTHNVDPQQEGRIQVQVPAVAGFVPSTWALPCVPLAGRQSGVWVLPQVGAHVWIEFEGGDIHAPIWVGGLWSSASDVPALALTGLPTSPSIVLQTAGQNALVISDAPGPTGGILLKGPTGALIAITDAGITISNGRGATILLVGPTVDINAGALTVT